MSFTFFLYKRNLHSFTILHFPAQNFGGFKILNQDLIKFCAGDYLGIRMSDILLTGGSHKP